MSVGLSAIAELLVSFLIASSCCTNRMYFFRGSICATDCALWIIKLTVFLPRDAMQARYMLSSCVLYLYLYVRLSVRPSHAGIVLKRLNT